MDEEGLRDTGKDKIYVGQPIEVNEGEFFNRLRHLRYMADMEDEDEVRYVIKELVPTYIIKEERGGNKVAITG